MSNVIRWKPGLLIGILAAVGMLAAVACGAAEEATPTPTSPPATPTPTSTPRPATPTPTTAVPPTATPTLRPGVTPVVATPTPTTAVPPTPTPTKGPQPKRGGIIKQSGTEDPPSFDSHTATSSAHDIHNHPLNTNLLWNPYGDLIVPDAAESYQISKDGKVWTFKLRDNVRFHTGYKPAHPRDGTLMTAADVKYSLEKMMGLIDDVVSARSGWMKEFIDIKRPDHGLVVVDNRTLEVHLTQPFGGLANILVVGFSSLYPEGTTREMLASRPYAAGAFRLKDFQRGSLWRYERNPDYFKPGLPYLDELHHVNIGSDAVAQSAFLTNKIDMATANPSVDNKPLYDKLVAEGKIRMPPYSTGCRPQGVNMNMYRPPFDNKKLRQAVNLAIDREAYTEVVHFGYAVPHLFLDTGGFGRTVEEIMKMPGYRQPHDQDVQEAKRIMAAEYPKGLSVNMKTRDSTGYMRQGEFIAGELRKVGINVTIDIMNSAQLFPLATAGNYEIWNYYFCQTTGTPEELFGSYFITGGSRNWLGGYSNPKIDAGYLDMAATGDPAERKRKAQALEALVLEDLPIAPLPVQTSFRNHWWYVMDLTTDNITFYTWKKLEGVWRSDA